MTLSTTSIISNHSFSQFIPPTPCLNRSKLCRTQYIFHRLLWLWWLFTYYSQTFRLFQPPTGCLLTFLFLCHSVGSSSSSSRLIIIAIRSSIIIITTRPYSSGNTHPPRSNQIPSGSIRNIRRSYGSTTQPPSHFILSFHDALYRSFIGLQW